MSSTSIIILCTILAYMCVLIGVGVYNGKKNASSEDFYLGGRKMGPYVVAMSAEASDMSSWLLMGLPGVAYLSGLGEAFWTAAGLAIGTYFNWLVVSKRLRRYSIRAGNAITLPEFFSNRFHEDKKVIRIIASLLILVFFTVYAGSCFVTCGKLFSTLFGYSYTSMMIVGAIFVIVYTFLGGFLGVLALKPGVHRQLLHDLDHVGRHPVDGEGRVGGGADPDREEGEEPLHHRAVHGVGGLVGLALLLLLHGGHGGGVLVLLLLAVHDLTADENILSYCQMIHHI